MLTVTHSHSKSENQVSLLEPELLLDQPGLHTVPTISLLVSNTDITVEVLTAYNINTYFISQKKIFLRTYY